MHRSVEYPGEVIVAENVDPDWGQTLKGELCFRLVFYTVPRRIAPGQISDPRIAMVVPRSASDPLRDRLNRELLAIRETQERYVTRGASGYRVTRSPIEERAESVSEEVSKRDALLYADGRIYTYSGTAVRPKHVFDGPIPNVWVDRVIEFVYLQAYPDLPFDHRDIPTTLTAERIWDIFKGLVQDDPASSEAARAFGPALGLSNEEAPARFEATRSEVVTYLAGALESQRGDAPAQTFLDDVCLSLGLSRTLAALYLFAFVRHANAEATLVAGHSLRSRTGGRYPGDTVLSDLIGEFVPSNSLPSQLKRVRSRPSIGWNTVLPYAVLLCEGARPSRRRKEIRDQEKNVTRALQELGGRVTNLKREVVSLAAILDQSPDDIVETLDAVQCVCASEGYNELRSEAAEYFGSPSALGSALRLIERLEKVAELAPRVAQVRGYLDGMQLGRGYENLALQRDAVAGRLVLTGLVSDPSLWSSTEDSFRRLRRDYSHAYLTYHTSYHTDSRDLAREIETARPRIEALERLNHIDGLGGAIGPDVSGRLEGVSTLFRTCSASEKDMELETSPVCESCHLPLGEELPRLETTAVLNEADNALDEYRHRLSSRGVSQVLADRSRGHLDKLIRLAQVSDLSSLDSVLDQEVVEFLRDFLEEG